MWLREFNMFILKVIVMEGILHIQYIHKPY